MRRKIFLHFVRNLPQTIIEQVKRICYKVSAVPEIDGFSAAYTFDGCDLRMIVSADRDRYIG